MIPLVVLVAAIAINTVGTFLDFHSSVIAEKIPGAFEQTRLYRTKDGKTNPFVFWGITAALATGHVVLYLFSNSFQYGVAVVEGVFAVEHFYGWAKNTRTVARTQ